MHDIMNIWKRLARLALACLALTLVAYALLPYPAFAQGGNNPLANAQNLEIVLTRNGFEWLQGGFRILDPISMACTGPGGKPAIPSTWYNNVQPYMTLTLPASWEKTKRAIPVNYLLGQDEAIVIVGS